MTIAKRVTNAEDKEFASHWERYVFAKNYVKDKDIVSLACGTGYGEFYLATEGRAKTVLGVDNSSEAIKYAQNHYQAENLIFKQADAFKNGILDQSADVIISFETIEHINDDNKLLGEFFRILKPGGVLILSTPNKASSFKSLLARPAINPFHVREYKKRNLENLLKKYFKNVEFFGQRLIFKRSFLRLPFYIYNKFLNKLKEIETKEDAVKTYPTASNLEMCYFVAVCKK